MITYKNILLRKIKIIIFSLYKLIKNIFNSLLHYIFQIEIYNFFYRRKKINIIIKGNNDKINDSFILCYNDSNQKIKDNIDNIKIQLSKNRIIEIIIILHIDPQNDPLIEKETVIAINYILSIIEERLKLAISLRFVYHLDLKINTKKMLMNLIYSNKTTSKHQFIKKYNSGIKNILNDLARYCNMSNSNEEIEYLLAAINKLKENCQYFYNTTLQIINTLKINSYPHLILEYYPSLPDINKQNHIESNNFSQYFLGYKRYWYQLLTVIHKNKNIGFMIISAIFMILLILQYEHYHQKIKKINLDIHYLLASIKNHKNTLIVDFLPEASAINHAFLSTKTTHFPFLLDNYEIHNLINQARNDIIFNNKKVKNNFYSRTSVNSCHYLVYCQREISLILRNKSSLIYLENNANHKTIKKLNIKLEKILINLNTLLKKFTNKENGNKLQFLFIKSFLLNHHKNNSIKNLYYFSNQLPKPLQSIFKNMSIHIWQSIVNTTHSYINNIWETTIYNPYIKFVANKYPINTLSSTELSLSLFNHYFSNSGLLMTFFYNYIQPLSLSISIKQQGPFTTNLFSHKTLYNFKLLQLIANNFFNHDIPSIKYTITPYIMDKRLSRFVFRYGNTIINYQHGPAISYKIQWPSANNDTLINLCSQQQCYNKVFLGTWGLFKLLHYFNITTTDNDNLNLLISINNHQVYLHISSTLPSNLLIKNPFSHLNLSKNL